MKTKARIIALTGPRRSGKSTLAEKLSKALSARNWSNRTYALAEPIYRLTAALIKRERDFLESSEFKNASQQKTLGADITGREVLECIGNGLRQHGAILGWWLCNLPQDVDFIIIPDVRVHCEMSNIELHNDSEIIHVKRPSRFFSYGDFDKPLPKRRHHHVCLNDGNPDDLDHWVANFLNLRGIGHKPTCNIPYGYNTKYQISEGHGHD